MDIQPLVFDFSLLAPWCRFVVNQVGDLTAGLRQVYKIQANRQRHHKSNTFGSPRE
jgi:hypothetical protein